MYLDQKRNRLLLMNGVSFVTSEHMAEHVMAHGEVPEHLKIEKSNESEAYSLLYGEDIGYEVTETDEMAPEPLSEDDYSLDDMLALVISSGRYVASEATDERIREELRFFSESGNLTMLVRCWELINRLLEDSIVVGVGRGSACASYVLFLLGVHDVDPIKYRIPFVELSKEVASESEDDE